MLFVRTLGGPAMGVELADLQTWGEFTARLEAQHPRYAGVRYSLIGEGGQDFAADPSRLIDQAAMRRTNGLTLVVRRGTSLPPARSAAAESAYQRSALEGMLAAMRDERDRLMAQLAAVEARLDETERRLAELE